MPGEPKWACVVVDFFMESRGTVEIVGLIADRRLLQLEANRFMDMIKEEQQEPPAAVAIAAGGGFGGAASPPPRAEQDIRSRKAQKKKKKLRRRKTTNYAGATGSK